MPKSRSNRFGSRTVHAAEYTLPPAYKEREIHKRKAKHCTVSLALASHVRALHGPLQLHGFALTPS